MPAAFHKAGNSILLFVDKELEIVNTRAFVWKQCARCMRFLINGAPVHRLWKDDQFSLNNFAIQHIAFA